MKRLLIAAVALLGLVGVAPARQAPALYGSNYSANVQQRYNGNQVTRGHNGTAHNPTRRSSSSSMHNPTRNTTGHRTTAAPRTQQGY